MAWFNFKKKNPTIAKDKTAYVSGGKKEYSDAYNLYINSVETLDKAVRVCANVASMARMGVYREIKGELKPYPIRNIDLVYDINETDSQSAFIRKTFASVFTQGAAIIIAAKGSSTDNIHFYPYNPAKFEIESDESAVLYKFKYLAEDGGTLEYDASEIIYVNNTIDITNLVYAVSRLKPLNDMLILQASILKQQQDFYSAGAKDSVIISPKEPLSSDAITELQTAFTTFVQSRSTKAMLINTDLDIKSVSNASTPYDMMQAMTQINDTIVESFGIPAYLFGDYKGYVSDDAVKTAAKLFFQIQLKPVFEELSHQMTKYFRNTLGLKKAEVVFSYEDIEILEDSLDQKIKDGEALLKLGVISHNEMRARVELPPLDIPEADYHYLPQYITGKPVPLEKYEELLRDGHLYGSDTSLEGPTLSGSSGGSDNTNLDTGSRGGPNE